VPDPKKIEKQKKVKSKKVTPAKALKDLDKLKDDKLEGVTGGYDDRWGPTPTPSFRKRDIPL